ncbi:hypothetical protein [Arthrobacter sp. USHLN218]
MVVEPDAAPILDDRILAWLRDWAGAAPLGPLTVEVKYNHLVK